MSETIKKGYEIETIVVTKENINKFEVMEHRRQIGEYHVRNILAALGTGKNSMGVIIVNRKQNRIRLIDGNHRIEALRRFLNRRSQEKTKVEITLKVYRNLNDEEERKVYTIEATRRNESHEDRLNMYKDTIMFWKLVSNPLKDFPCEVTIYGSKKSIRLRVLLNALYSTESSPEKGYNPIYLKKNNLVEFAQEMNFEDFRLMKEFMTFFKDTFGRVEHSNIHIKTQFFMPLFDIYIRNRQQKDSRTFQERFRKVMGRSELLVFLNSTGKESQEKIREIMIRYMNYNIQTKSFV